VTDASGNYELTNLAPGTYTVAIVPQAGYVQTTPASSYTVTITADGTQITGKNFGEELPLPDLATSGVTFSPTGAGPGQSLGVSWVVQNQGNGAAVGSWEDAIYLSPTPTLGTSAVLLTTAPRSGGLALNGQYTGSATVSLPALPGTWYVIVQADFRNQVNEGAFGANKANNTAASTSTLLLTIPTIMPNTPVPGTFTGPDSGFYYQISVTPGQTLTLSLASAASSGADEVYVRRGAFPDPDTFDYVARTPGQPNQTVTVPASH
jgi:hypothetical protein